ncbi:unnamed protein product [Rotaria sp. Silwood2]|nr:unnamed protein product [Rotaria sp. Silwood2]CAF3075173.1 unnamed protein product [Rotaria sp. Silwood2]CAF4280805.1 unnamed protein product [Rotaria sp. Silwood2]
MLACQQKSVTVMNNENEKSINSVFITCSQLAAHITACINNIDRKVLIIDCGSTLRHAERRIQSSILLNVNDKISRKRLATRGLKNFLDINQFNRLENNEILILYDDSIRVSSLCSNSSIQSQLSPSMKCVYDEIKRFDINKTIYVLESPFDEFYQNYPLFCYISRSTDEDLSSPPPSAAVETDIGSYQISEVLPGLYLGNSQDAENFTLLQQHQIKVIINVSTSIPCYFENDNVFEYLRLPCHDSPHQNIRQYFETTFEYIHQKLSMNKNILVHCQGGVSRSSSFVIGYLMKYHSKTFTEAHRFVRTKRSIVNPNLNFVGQLTQYEQSLSAA